MTDTSPARIAAVDAMIQAVEAGEAGWNRLASIAEDAMPPKEAALAATANRGSLDAARALHDAVLPDRSCGITFGVEYGATVTFPPTWDDLHISQSHEIPARAWLLAILRAIKSQVNHDSTSPPIGRSRRSGVSDGRTHLYLVGSHAADQPTGFTR